MPTPDLSRARWRKSTRSGGNGECVEVAAVWRKSTRSGAIGECVEVADLNAAIAVRDSKDPGGPKLIFTTRAWRAFADRVKGRTYNL